jgi:hypothetical protein
MHLLYAPARAQVKLFHFVRACTNEVSFQLLYCPAAAEPHRRTGRADACRDPDPNPESQRYGLETHALPFQKKRDTGAFAESCQELDRLRTQAQAGEIEPAYLGEVSFAQVHPKRSAWPPLGEQHLIDAPRDKRLSVIASLLSSGTVEVIDTKLFPIKLAFTTKAAK